ERRKAGNLNYSFMGGGLNSNRFNELIERALETKAKQFTKNGVAWPKILIVCCGFPESFSSLDNFLIQEPINNNLFIKYPYHSAIIVDGHFEITCVPNPQQPKYPLTAEECKFIHSKIISKL
ncbi:MAG: hypothetical protein V1644_00055, partial [Candidatus Micrarchaeota archaeon]